MSGPTTRQAQPIRWALTLHRPWAGAILYATKRTENRSWAPRTPPGRIGLHAGTTLDAAGIRRLEAYCHGDLPENAFDRGLVGTAAVRGTHPAADCPGGPSCRVWGTSSGWHWLLEDVRALARPIPATGRQRLWRLSTDQARALAGAAPVPDITQDLALDAAGVDLVQALRSAATADRRTT